MHISDAVTGKSVAVDSGGALSAKIINSLLPERWSRTEAEYPTDTQEVYTFYLRETDNSLTLIGTLTVNYTDDSKEFLQDAEMVRV